MNANSTIMGKFHLKEMKEKGDTLQIPLFKSGAQQQNSIFIGVKEVLIILD